MVLVFIILDWIFVMMNTTTMIPRRRVSGEKIGCSHWSTTLFELAVILKKILWSLNNTDNKGEQRVSTSIR